MNKKIWKTKTFWVGIASVAGGLALGLTGKLDWSQAVQLISTGLTGIFIRDGLITETDKQLKNKGD